MNGSSGTDWSVFFSNLPPIGWIVIILFMGLVTVLFYGIFRFFEHRNIRFKDMEFAEKDKKELYQTEGKNLLDNQCNTAHNLLEKIWIDIYENARVMFEIEDPKDLFILEDICHLIEGQLNYEVKNDLTRNHITEKTDMQLEFYSEGKAKGYYQKVKSMLYKYNVQLLEVDLPTVMQKIPFEEYGKIFHEIYFSAREIAGFGGKK